MELNRIWRQEITGEAGQVPLVATAIHDGHALREEVPR